MCCGLLLAAVGCGGDDDDGPSNPYYEVVEWKCYERGLSCSCDGLQEGQDSAGSNQVDSCAGPVCKAFLEDDWWTCECRNEDWDPKEAAVEPITQLYEVESCPPPP